MIWAGHVARIVENRKAYRLFVGKPEGKRPLRRPNGCMDYVEICWNGVEWIGHAQDKEY
jgi:hypothetical protein